MTGEVVSLLRLRPKDRTGKRLEEAVDASLTLYDEIIRVPTSFRSKLPCLSNDMLNLCFKYFSALGPNQRLNQFFVTVWCETLSFPSS